MRGPGVRPAGAAPGWCCAGWWCAGWWCTAVGTDGAGRGSGRSGVGSGRVGWGRGGRDTERCADGSGAAGARVHVGHRRYASAGAGGRGSAASLVTCAVHPGRPGVSPVPPGPSGDARDTGPEEGDCRAPMAEAVRCELPRPCPVRRTRRVPRSRRPTVRAACRSAADAPPPTGRPAQRRALVAVVAQRAQFVAGQERAVRAYDPPPGHRGAVERHRPADLARSAVAQPLGDVAVGHDVSGRDQVGDVEDPLGVLRELGGDLRGRGAGGTAVRRRAAGGAVVHTVTLAVVHTVVRAAVVRTAVPARPVLSHPPHLAVRHRHRGTRTDISGGPGRERADRAGRERAPGQRGESSPSRARAVHPDGSVCPPAVPPSCGR